MQSTQTQNLFNKLFKSRTTKINNGDAESNSLEEQSEEFKHIQSVIENDIKPYIKSHGGKITLLKVEANCISVNLDGACRNCPAIQFTMKGFVEKVIKDKFPEIKEVILQKLK